MHIGLIAPGFSRDVNHLAIPALQNLAVWLAQGHEVSVFSLRYPAAGLYQFAGLRHQAIGGGTRFSWRSLPIWGRAVRAIWRAHGQRPFHLLHAFWVDEAGLTAVLAAKRLHLPVIASIGGGELVYLADIGYGTAGSAGRRAIVQATLRQAQLITAGSLYQLGQVAGAGHKVLAPLGLDTAVFKPASIANWQQPTIIQVASLTAVKNQSLLLEIVALVKRAVPAVRLLLVGDGPLAAPLQALAAKLGIADNIIWAGAQPYLQMAALYQQAHLYLQTSRHEAQGMALLEALACGLPAIGTPVGVLPQVAALAPSWQKAVLAEQAIALLTQPAAYEQRRAQARETAVAHYDLANTGQGFLHHYANLSRAKTATQR